MRTTCPLCGGGCGVIVRARPDGGITVDGDPAHPANLGRLCDRAGMLDALHAAGRRAVVPLVHGRPATWHQALHTVAEGLARTLDRHGPEAIAFCLSGALPTEDGYVVNKLAKGFLGTPHVDVDSRAAISAIVSGHRRALGSDTAPNLHEDIEEAELVVLVGVDAARRHPVVVERMQRARRLRGMRLVRIDPARSAAGEPADLLLTPLRGSEGVLFSWLLVEIVNRGREDADYLAAHTNGFPEALQRAGEIAPNLRHVAATTGLAESDIERFVEWFIATQATLTCIGQDADPAGRGADRVNAILNCHLATGRLGRPGSGLLALSGQPNGMGLCEVGCLAGMLAAHMGYSQTEIDRVRRFWAAPRMAERPGLRAADMLEAVERGRIKALWLMQDAAAEQVWRAEAGEVLGRLDLLVVSQSVLPPDGTAPHVLLPTAGWGEAEGTTTVSGRLISRRRAFREPEGEARPVWRQVSAVARRFGFEEAFSFEGPADIFREHAELTGFENGGQRDLDIGGLARLSDEAYAGMEPLHWPRPRRGGQQDRFFAEGRFFTGDGRAELVAIERPALRGLADEVWPFLLSSTPAHDFRVATTLALRSPVPFVAVNPEDAARLGLEAQGYAKLSTAQGRATLQVRLDDAQAPGTLHAPAHWSKATATHARVETLFPAGLDTLAQSPEPHAAPAAIEPATMRSEGFLVARRPQAMPGWLWHAKLPLGDGAEAVLFASSRAPSALQGLLSNYIVSEGTRLSFSDEGTEEFRSLSFAAERLEMALFIGRRRCDAMLDWVLGRLGETTLDAATRRALIAGKPPAGAAAQGALARAGLSISPRPVRSAG